MRCCLFQIPGYLLPTHGSAPPLPLSLLLPLPPLAPLIRLPPPWLTGWPVCSSLWFSNTVIFVIQLFVAIIVLSTRKKFQKENTIADNNLSYFACMGLKGIFRIVFILRPFLPPAISSTGKVSFLGL